MTESEAKQLQIGDSVIWDDDRSDLGEVISIQPRGIGICWSGAVTVVQVVLWKDIEHVSLWMPLPQNQ